MNTANKTSLTIKEQLKQRLLDNYDVRELFKVSRGTINNWCKNGELPFLKIGKRRYFDALQIKRKLQQQLDNRVPGEYPNKNEKTR